MSQEIHPFTDSPIRKKADRNGVLPVVALVPDKRPNYHDNTDRYTLIDTTHGGVGEATVVRGDGLRYFTRLEIRDKELDLPVRVAAYILAAEDTMLRHGERFVNDPRAERKADVDAWQLLEMIGVATIEKPFAPFQAAHAGKSTSGLYEGKAFIRPDLV